MKHRHLLFLVLLASWSCEPPFVFSEPQPEVWPESTEFASDYQGRYRCSTDTSIVYVTKKDVYKEKSIYFEVALDEVSTLKGAYIEGNLLHFDQSIDPIEITYISIDSIAGEYNLRDTLFSIDEEHIVKHYKGHQILNYRLDDLRWAVAILSHDDSGNLSYWATVLPDDLSELEEITPVTNISVDDYEQYLLTPNIAEFRKLLRSKLIFEASDYFERLPSSSSTPEF